MSQSTPIVIFGAGGRMGRMLLTEVAAAPDQWELLGAVERSDHPDLGTPLTQLVPTLKTDVVLTDAPPRDIVPGSVGIHFSLPVGTIAHLFWHREGGRPALICTTGFTDEQRAELDALAAEVPVIVASNTSVGVNMLNYLAGRAASMLGPEYEIEIVEMHHHGKRDAPSGTARTLAETVLAARGGDYARDTRHGRHGDVGARTPEELGMHALRGGSVVGEHTVILAGPNERIELTHRAQGRELFVPGALRAAQWLVGRPAGHYTMSDVLGLSEADS